jgi:DNA-binding NarL/FixJ family response regulator
VLQAIRQVLNGEIFLSKRVSRSILNVLAGRRQGSAQAQLSGLTDREFEVFEAIGQGLSTYEIGKRLAISAKTVSTHRMHIKEKLSLPTGTDLVQHAIRWVTTQQLV